MWNMRIKKGRLKDLSSKHAVFVIEYMKDFDPRRAAEASGHAPDKGAELIDHPQISIALEYLINDRMIDTGIDTEYLMFELADNHRIARQQGNISASNTALKILAQFASIDALASTKVDVDVNAGQGLVEALIAGRNRVSNK